MNDGQPHHRELNGTADYIAALDEVCGLAQHTLYIYEKDFDNLGFDSVARHDALHHLLLVHPTARLHLLGHDVQPLLRYCPRMMTLLRQFSHKMEIRRIPRHLQHLTEPFAVADEAHYARRFHFDDARGILAIDDAPGARTLKSRFEEMWAVSHPAASATVTGL